MRSYEIITRNQGVPGCEPHSFTGIELKSAKKQLKYDRSGYPSILFVNIHPGSGDENVWDVAKSSMSDKNFRSISQLILHFRLGFHTYCFWHKQRTGKIGVFWDDTRCVYDTGAVEDTDKIRIESSEMMR